MESLEDTLFEDIRASIQKASKASNMTNSNRKVVSAETDNPVNCSVKKVDLTSRNRLTTNAALKKQTIGIQGSGRMIKQGSRYPQVTQPALQNGNSTSSLSQPPKVISRAETITTKRASMGANRVKAETHDAKVGGKGVQVPKATGLAGPPRSVPKPVLSSNSSCSASFGASKKEAARSSSSCDGSKSTVSDKIRKSPLISARRKIESRPVIKASSCSIPKASSRVPLRKKSSNNTGVSTSLTSKISSSISPASSISEWSSASSSTSTVNQRSKSRASIDTSSSCRSLDSDTLPVLCLDVQYNDHISDGIVNQVTGLPSQDIKRTSMQSGLLSRSALMKPSGLRLPSPKIGFFDGAKSAVRTPSGGTQSQPQSRLPTGLPKIGAGICSPVGSSKKAKDGKLPPGIKATICAILDTSKSASPKTFQESLRASKKAPGVLRGMKSPSISSEVHDDTSGLSCYSQVGSSNKVIGKFGPGMTVTSTNTNLEREKIAYPKPVEEALSASPGISPEVHNETGGISCLKAEDEGIGKPDVAEPTTVHTPEAEKNENQIDLKGNINFLIQGNAEVEQIKIGLTKVDISDSSKYNCIEYLKSSHEMGEDEVYGEHLCNGALIGTTNVKQIVHPSNLVDINVKQIVHPTTNVKVVDIQVEMQKELTDSLNSQSEVGYIPDYGALELSSKKQLLDQKEVASVSDLLPSSTRTPLAAKDSLCNIEDIDMSEGTEVAEKINILHSSAIVQTPPEQEQLNIIC